MHHRHGSPVARLLLGIVSVMAIAVIIQSVAAGVGWGVLAVIAAIYMVTRRGKYRR